MLPALLFLVPVVVVDVTGDRLDPPHTRLLVEKELSVTAVAPDDPRAATATGRIEVSGSAKDRTLTVKVRMAPHPVERTMELADDEGRAETDAALLVGNLARDEANELTPAPKAKPQPQPQPSEPARSQPLVKWNDDERDLAQMRAFLTQSAKDERAAYTRSAIIQFVAAGAFLAPTVYLIADGEGGAASAFAYPGGMFSAALIAGGIGDLVGRSDDLGPLAKKLREHEQRHTDASDAIEDVEKAWAKRSTIARSSRLSTGWLFTIAGGVVLAAGAATAFAEGANGDYPATGIVLLGAGTLGALYGVSTLANESPVETSYRMWRTVKTAPETGTRVSFGAASLPGGGGAASFALTF